MHKLTPPEQTLLSQVRPNTPRTDHLRGIVSNIFGLSQRLNVESSRLNSDVHLSDKGRGEELSKFAKRLAKDLAEISRPARVARMDIAAKRSSFKLPEVDRTDVVGEMKRAEIRAYICALPLEDKMRAVESDDAVALAVLDAKPMLCDLPPDRYEHIRNGYLARRFGSQMKEIEELVDDFTCVESAKTMVGKELQAASGLSYADFSALEKSHET